MLPGHVLDRVQSSGFTKLSQHDMTVIYFHFLSFIFILFLSSHNLSAILFSSFTFHNIPFDWAVSVICPPIGAFVVHGSSEISRTGSPRMKEE